MDFSTEKAIEIIKKHNLSDCTLKTWRLRGYIPKKYDNPDFISFKSVERIESEKDAAESNRIISLLQNSKLNRKKIALISGINPMRLNDILREKTYISKIEYLEIKKTINRLTIEAKIVLGLLSVKNPIVDKRIIDFFFNGIIKPYVFLNNETVVKQLKWFLRNNPENTPLDSLIVFRDELTILILELNMS